jgi:hypothetical protein
MNTYSKYVPNVFLAKCAQQYKKGDIINVTTKYGKDNACEIFNFIYQKDGAFFYSILRSDGFNLQEHAKRKAEKYNTYANSAAKKSDSYYNASNKDRSFLSLGEPIKVGHHSEKRHRRIIEQAHNNMSKCVEFSKQADAYENKAEYWANKQDHINLSMPESLQFYEYQLEKATKQHQDLKSGKIERRHSFSLTYAKKEMNEIEKKLNIARKLWGEVN